MINLLPPKRLLNIRIARNNTNLRRYIELLMLSICVLVFAVVASYYFLSEQQKNTKQTVDLNKAKVAELQPVQKQAEELSATVNTISGLLVKDVTFSDTLTKIGGLMPSGSVLTGLQFSIENLKAPLVVSAQVESEQKGAVLRNNLASSELFSKADIVSIVEIEEKEVTVAPVDPAAPAAPIVTPSSNPYKYTATINVYFKDISGAKKL